MNARFSNMSIFYHKNTFSHTIKCILHKHFIVKKRTVLTFSMLRLFLLSTFNFYEASHRSNSRTTLNKSPSTKSCIFPCISSIRLPAIDKPRPFPSVFLELSPRTNRSISSSLEMFSGYLDVLRNVICTFSPVCSKLI